MKQLTINPNNRQYYPEDFIKGFECGTQRQLEADKADIPTWIPCSEGLPKQDGRYLCTVVVAYRNPRELYYAPKDLATETDENTWRDTDGFYVHNWFVDAWMPIPEPWRGAGDDTD